MCLFGRACGEASRVAGVAAVMAADAALLVACLVWACHGLAQGGVLAWVAPWVSWPRLAALCLLGAYPVPWLLAGLGTSLGQAAELLVAEWPLRRRAATTGRRLVLLRCLTALLLLPAPVAFRQHERRVAAAAAEGLRRHLDQYAYAPGGRRHLHGLQRALGCCGAASLEDWFNVTQHAPQHSWLRRRGSVGPLPPTDEVPFSCCRPFLLRRCVARGLRQQVTHLMRHERPSVHTLGCVARLLQAAEAQSVGGYVLVLWGLVQLPGLCLLLRVLTTSMHAAAWRAHRLRRGDLTLPAAGWLVTDRSPCRRGRGVADECLSSADSPRAGFPVTAGGRRGAWNFLLTS